MNKATAAVTTSRGRNAPIMARQKQVRARVDGGSFCTRCGGARVPQLGFSSAWTFDFRGLPRLISVTLVGSVP